jgi:hypothetical protein
MTAVGHKLPVRHPTINGTYSLKSGSQTPEGLLSVEVAQAMFREKARNRPECRQNSDNPARDGAQEIWTLKKAIKIPTSPDQKTPSRGCQLRELGRRK